MLLLLLLLTVAGVVVLEGPGLELEVPFSWKMPGRTGWEEAVDDEEDGAAMKVEDGATGEGLAGEGGGAFGAGAGAGADAGAGAGLLPVMSKTSI